jgi:hypothetical protein
MKELWKKVIDYEDYYIVSNIGRVKNLKTNKIIAQTLNKDGYWCCGLYKNKKHKVFITHRLMMIAFVPNPENKEQVNHINAIKTDNILVNLEWSTPKENTIHACKMGLMNYSKGSEHYASKLTDEDVIEIRRLSLSTTKIKISKIYNVSDSCICNIVNRKRWKHI